MISKGKRVRIAYNLTVDGKLVQSISPNKPLRFIQGKKEISRGLENALKGLKVGERKTFILEPKDGFGLESPKSYIEMLKSRFPKKDHYIGKEITSIKDGKYLATVKEVRAKTLILNFNHPLAGKKLHYDVIVVAIEGEEVAVFKKVKTRA